MVEGGQQVGLPLQAGEALLVGSHYLRQDLDRYLALQAGVVGAIHLTHTASAQRLDNLVMAESGTWLHDR